MAGTWIDEHGLRKRLAGLPLILCGPVLGRAEPRSVTVWVALKAAMTVTLRVYTRFDPGSERLLTERAIGTRRTIRLGQSLHVVAVTATPSGEPLMAGRLYFYDLYFSAGPAAVPVPETALSLRTTGRDEIDTSMLSYSREPLLPSFSLPPDELNKLRLGNCSCRKPDGTNGLDAMPILDEILAVDWPVADDRPHQLLLTGDQVYADGSTGLFLFLLMDAARALLGWEESPPGVDHPDELLPGRRSRIVKELAGLTTDDPENHALLLGEYVALHLLGWSRVLWPETFPELAEVQPDLTRQLPELVAVHQRNHKSSVARLTAFRDTLPAVRRVLANVPTYMLFDDHDVTDDWNMFRDWAERVYLKPLGRRLVQNGLAAYAVCQAWGTTPDRFEAGQPGGELLAALTAWANSGGKDPAAEAEIAKRVGLPLVTTTSGVRALRFDAAAPDGAQTLARPEGAMHWHYTVTGPRHEVLALDSRTRRAFPPGKLDVPAQIGPADLEQQVPLRDVPSNAVTLVIATTNLLTIPFFEGRAFYGQKKAAEQIRYWYLWLLRDSLFEVYRFFKGSYSPDLSDSWVSHSPPFEAVLARLARRAASAGGARSSRVVVLSGDVHFSWAGRLRYWAQRPFQEPAAQSTPEPVSTIFAFLTSSALKADGNPIQWITHHWGYVPMQDKLPEVARWLGWQDVSAFDLNDADLENAASWDEYVPWLARQTPPMLALKDVPQHDFRPARPPDWRYRIDFVLSDEPSEPPAPIKPLPSDADGADRATWLNVISEAQARHKRYAQDWGNGQEIIGKNNLAVLRFCWDGETTLTTAISATAKSLRLADSTGFPDPPFRVHIGAETLEVRALVRGTTHEGSELVRGVWETKAAAHDAGARVTVAKTVVQTHWWRPTDKDALKPRTSYTVSLELDDARYPPPLLRGESHP